MKTNQLLLIGLFIFLFSIISCRTAKHPMSDNSMNSLDWEGSYLGTLPCADCEGLQTMISLNRDSTYFVETEYLGRSNKINLTMGTFSWDKSGGIIKLISVDKNIAPSLYAVGENRLTQLDVNGKPITGNIADKFVLKKQSPLVEKYWKLTEINGKKIDSSMKLIKEPDLIFKATDNRVIGNGGCNSFTGRYEFQSGNQIKILGVAATRMACPNMDIETQLFKVFVTVGTYTIEGNTLLLKDAAGIILAKFKNVHLM